MASCIKSVSSSAQELRCPICLDFFTAPKHLPCLHTYCQHCLHKYIVKNVPKGKKGATFNCPECRKETFPPLPDIPVDEWAEHYPYNAVLLSVLPPEKRKVDKNCDSCSYEGDSVRATCFCTVCKEALCAACEKMHKKNKASRDHTVVNIQNVFTDPELAVNLSVSVSCTEHVGKEFEFYCKSHSSMCCSECFYNGHRVCREVLKLKDHSERLLKEKEANTVLDRLKQLRSDLDRFKKENEVSFENIEAEANNISDEIDEHRNKINTVLDNVKAKITMEKNAFLKEESLVRHEENQQCESISSAVANSLHLLETVLAHGNPLHALTILHKIEEHLVHYESTVKEKYCDVRRVEVRLCIDDHLLSLIKSCETTIVKINIVEKKTSHTPSALLPIKENTINIPGVSDSVSQAKTKHVEGQEKTQNSFKSLKDCKPRQVGQFNADYTDGKIPKYTGVTCLPDDKIMLVDYNNFTCRLYDSSHQHLSDYKLSSRPRDVCVLEGSEVVVTLPDEKKILRLTVDRSIQPESIINTSLSCHGIAVLSNDQLVVSGTRINSHLWCIISLDGSEKFSVMVRRSHWYSYLAVNSRRTCIYISWYQNPAAVYAYSVDGTLIFKYVHHELDGALGVAVDREDNLYVIGNRSHNIHQVLQSGPPLQVFSTEIPNGVDAICFAFNADKFILTYGAHIAYFQLV